MNKQTYNVESFELDHTQVKAPYLREVAVIQGDYGDRITKYDLRINQPNESYMDMAALHSFEHLIAENLRNHLTNVVDISPMGCQTGFYFSLLNSQGYTSVKQALIATLKDIAHATEVPAANIYECGRAFNHDLEGAKKIAQFMLNTVSQWDEVFSATPH